MNVSAVEDNQEARLREGIVAFFLNLFRIQLGAYNLDEDETEFRTLPFDASSLRYTYELRVKRQGEWKTRRMAIGPLGEHSASKSKCYKVFYDDILVVKIPPQPIKVLSDYIESMNVERRIADRLHPHVECVSPSLTALLKRIPRFQNKQEFPNEALEEQYLKALQNSLLLQEHLKIGDSFAFFMTLSKYSFFSQIIEKMHSIKAKVQEEIFTNFEALWDLDAFELIYGRENDAVFFGINDACTDYERDIGQLLNQHTLTSDVPIYQRKEWLLNRLADKAPDKNEKALPEEFIRERDAVLDRIVKENHKEIESYRHTVVRFMRRKNFEQHEALFRGIVPNILDLLARLFERGVAIRDLKPDNIFVVGDANNYPHFLKASSQFSLGLIDLETAICFTNQAGGAVAQPQLAGTPSYATPSHVFRNKLLSQVFGELPRLFYLQDWYAALGMIYAVVTGERLFEKTGKLLAEIIRNKHLHIGPQTPLANYFKNSSHRFWESARAEIEAKLQSRAPLLDSVEITITERTRRMLGRECIREKERIEAAVNEHIAAQPMFASEKSRQVLSKMSLKAVRRHLSNWEQGKNVPAARPAVRDHLVWFFRRLEQLKVEHDRLVQFIVKVIKSKQAVVSVSTVMELLFAVVYHAMYAPEWAEIVVADAPATQQEPFNLSQEETLTLESTL